MGLFSKPDPQAMTVYRKARKALDANSAAEKRRGIRDETPKFRRLNSAVLRAERDVPWWRR